MCLWSRSQYKKASVLSVFASAGTCIAFSIAAAFQLSCLLTCHHQLSPIVYLPHDFRGSEGVCRPEGGVVGSGYARLIIYIRVALKDRFTQPTRMCDLQRLMSNAFNANGVLSNWTSRLSATLCCPRKLTRQALASLELSTVRDASGSSRPASNAVVTFLAMR